MGHAQTRSLARFCAGQYFGFEPRAWGEFAALGDRAMVAAAARYLSMTSWYGREEELARIAASLAEAPGAHGADTRATADAQARSFDLEHFSGLLRVEIATRRLGAAPSAFARPNAARR